MAKKVTYDFDGVVSRAGTHAEKYEARMRWFGRTDVQPLWVADMDLPAPAFLVNALRRRLDHALFGYTAQYAEVFDAIRWWLEDQHGAVVDREWISLSPSVVSSIAVAVRALTRPDESVVVLSPVYGPFSSFTAANGRNVLACPLEIEQGRFMIDFPALERILAREDVTLLLHCNPQNPGGRVWTAAELSQLARLCADNGVTLFGDEIHCDIVHPPHHHVSLLDVDAARDIVVVAHSIGKTFNTSGLQASFVVIPDPALRRRFRAELDRTHSGDVNLLGKVALAAALSPAGAEYKRQLVTYLHGNTSQVCQKLQALESAAVMVPEATYLVWCDLRGYGPEQAVAGRLIDNAGVGLMNGRAFGPAGEGWFRINCAHPRAQLLPAIDRIVDEFS